MGVVPHLRWERGSDCCDVKSGLTLTLIFKPRLLADSAGVRDNITHLYVTNKTAFPEKSVCPGTSVQYTRRTTHHSPTFFARNLVTEAVIEDEPTPKPPVSKK